VLFIHLGEGKVRHLFPNMQRVAAQIRGKNIEVVLAATNDNLISEARSLNFKAIKYSTKPEVQSVFDRHTQEHDYKFRDGFWRYSIERLFAISDVFEQLDAGSILHIESDVITFKNFPFSEVFQLINTTWCRFNDDSDVAALLFLPSQEKSELLKMQLLELLADNPNLTDMSALSLLARIHSSIDYFPLVERKDSLYLNSNTTSPKSADQVSKLFKKFNGIFDAAPLGMYILGQDPRNNWGMVRRKIKLPHSSISPELFKLQLTQTGNLSTEDGVNVYCLHAHSKELKLFAADNSRIVNEILEKNKSSKKNSEFSIRAFLELIAEYRKRKKLFSLMVNFPYIRSARNRKIIKFFESMLRGKNP